MEIPIGNQTNHIMEASAPLYGLLYAKSMNIEKIWLEGDSLNIINYLNKVTTPSWTIHNIIYKAINLTNAFNECVGTHNYIESNKVTDWTTNFACKI